MIKGNLHLKIEIS